MPKVPLLDLTLQYRSIREEIRQTVDRVLESQQFILGAEVIGLEAEIAAYCQTRHCVGVSSGSDALLVALMALEIGPGDEVITSPYSFFATAGSIARLGATPVFVDIDPDTYNIDADKVASAVTSRTKAIMPVHLFGQCADMTPILEVASRHGLAVIEDACQAIGAEFHGKRAGSMGTVGCFSFFPSKNLGAFGDGGAVTTNDDALAERMRCLRVHGSQVKYYHTLIGANFRLDALQAAVLRVKLKHLDMWTAARQRNASWYYQALRGTGLADSAVGLTSAGRFRHVFNQFVIHTTERDALKHYLAIRDVGTEVYYPVPLHLQECFKYLGYRAGELPASERAAQTTLALPVYPELTIEQRQYVVDAIAGYFKLAGQSATRAAA